MFSSQKLLVLAGTSFGLLGELALSSCCCVFWPSPSGTVYSEKTCDLVFENATFDSPKELQSGLQGCTTIKGHIIQLSPIFGDTLTFPGLKEIEGGIAVTTDTASNTGRKDFHGQSALKSIVLDNLTSIGNLTLGDAFALQDLYLPSLMKTDYLELHSNKSVHISLPDVRSIEKLLLRGSSM